ELEGLTLRPHRSGSKTFLPEGVPPRSADSLFMYAARGRVMTAEEARVDYARLQANSDARFAQGDLGRGRIVHAEAAGREETAETEAEESAYVPEWPDGAIVCRLSDVLMFVSNELLQPGEPSGFRHRIYHSVFYLAYDPESMRQLVRLPKQLSFFALWDELDAANAGRDQGTEDDYARKHRAELSTE